MKTQIKKSKFTRFTYSEEWGEFSRVAEYSIIDKQAAERPTIGSSSQAAQIFRKEYAPNQIGTKEFFYLAILNNNNKLLTIAKISEGSDVGTVVDKAEVLRRVLLIGGKAFILCHNHPSGNKRPSDMDRGLTRELKAAADMLGLKMLDHVILTQDEFFSFADNQLI